MAHFFKKKLAYNDIWIGPTSRSLISINLEADYNTAKFHFKSSQIFGELLGYFSKYHFWVKPAYFGGNFWKILGYPMPQHLVTLGHTRCSLFVKKAKMIIRLTFRLTKTSFYQLTGLLDRTFPTLKTFVKNRGEMDKRWSFQLGWWWWKDVSWCIAR